MKNSAHGESGFTLRKYSEYSIKETVMILLSHKVKHKGEYKRFPISVCCCSISGLCFNIFM